MYNIYFLSSGLKANIHRRGSLYSIHPWRIGFLCGDSTVTSSFLNTTVQFTSQIGPTPISVFVKVGMMQPFVGKSAFTCGMESVAVAVELATCPFAVPNLICFPVVSIFSYGAFGAMYICVAPESTIPVFSGGKCLSVLFDTYTLLLVGLKLKLASYFKLSLLGLLSTTVLALAGPKCHASLKTMPFASISFVAQPVLFLFSLWSNKN